MNHGERIKKDGNLIYLPTGRDPGRRRGVMGNVLPGTSRFSDCIGGRRPQREADMEQWDLPSSPVE